MPRISGMTISNLRIRNNKALESGSGDELDMTHAIGILCLFTDDPGREPRRIAIRR